MHAHDAGHHDAPPGTDALHLLGPLIVGISIVTMVLLIAVSLTSIERDIDLPPLRPATIRPAADDVAPPPPRPIATWPTEPPAAEANPPGGPVPGATGTAYWPTRELPPTG